MKREHTQKAMILLILYCIVAFPHFAFGQNGNQSPPPPSDERLPNDACERCNGEIVPWGALQCSEVIISPLCTLKVCYRKRECWGRKQIKIVSTSFPEGSFCNESHGDFTHGANNSLLIHMLTKPEPFGLIPPGDEFEMQQIDIFRYPCKTVMECHISNGMGGTTKRFIEIPCVKRACCKMHFNVWKKDSYCSVETINGRQDDESNLKPRCNMKFNDFADSEGENYGNNELAVWKEIYELYQIGALPCLEDVALYLLEPLPNPPPNPLPIPWPPYLKDRKFRTDRSCSWDCPETVINISPP